MSNKYDAIHTIPFHGIILERSRVCTLHFFGARWSSNSFFVNQSRIFSSPEAKKAWAEKLFFSLSVGVIGDKNLNKYEMNVGGPFLNSLTFDLIFAITKKKLKIKKFSIL